MPLLTIADLEQTEEELAPYIKMAEQLSGMYFDYVANNQSETYEYSVKIFGGNSKERKTGIHASEISKCKRLLVYSIMGTERKPSATNTNINMLMRFSVGHALHAMVQNDWHRIAKKSGGSVLFEDEVRVHPALGGKAEEWTLHTSCDGVVTLCKDGVPQVRVGLEIKTASGPSFDKLRMPQKDHQEQTCLYMAALDLPLMWTLYYNKSSSSISPSKYPFLYMFDRDLWENELEMRFAYGEHMAETNQLPDREEGMQCDWCPYSYTCKPLKHQRNAPTSVSRGMRRRKQ